MNHSRYFKPRTRIQGTGPELGRGRGRCAAGGQGHSLLEGPKGAGPLQPGFPASCRKRGPWLHHQMSTSEGKILLSSQELQSSGPSQSVGREAQTLNGGQAASTLRAPAFHGSTSAATCQLRRPLFSKRYFSHTWLKECQECYLPLRKASSTYDDKWGLHSAAPAERSALKTGAVGGEVGTLQARVGWGSRGQGHGLASGPSSTVEATSVSPRNLVGPQPQFRTARTHSGSDATFQGRTLSRLRGQRWRGKPQVPACVPCGCGRATLGLQRMGEEI